VDKEKREAIRIDTYAFSVIVRFIALLMFIGTIYVAYEADQLGWSFNVAPQHNPLPWIVLATGVVGSLLTFSMGLGLAMLCAIYDQQDVRTNKSEERGRPKLIPSTEPPFPPPPSRAKTADTTTMFGRSSASSIRTTPPPENIDNHDAGEREKSINEKSGLWEQLTRERHLSRKADEQNS